MRKPPSNTIYCVGGGPSLKGFTWNKLAGRRVIAVNRAYETCPNAEAVYFSDLRFWLWHRDGLLAHKGRLITGAKHVSHPRVETWLLTGKSGLELSNGKLKSGNNSGYAAMNLAVHLKARRIILLGYDMRFLDGKCHWHSGHIVQMQERVFDNMIPYFDTLGSALAVLNIEVINASPDSALETFEKCDINDPAIWQ